MANDPKASKNPSVVVGILGSVQTFLPTTTANGSTQLILNSIWIDATPTLLAEVLAGNALTWVLLNNANITLTIATNSMTAGGMNLYCDWIPVSVGATVV
jgi:hypothetical protein